MLVANFQRRYGDLFGVVFACSFAATFLLHPLVLMSRERNTGSDAPAGLYVLFLLVGGIALAIPLVLKAAIIAPVVFVVVILVLDWVVADLLVFVLACLISAYATCWLGMMVNIDLFPPAVNWEPSREGFAASLATTAAGVAAVVSTLTFLLSRESRAGVKNE